jgi:hypothetical protein
MRSTPFTTRTPTWPGAGTPIAYSGPWRQASMASIEWLEGVVHTLVARRQALRERDADNDELESNRLELARRQRELTHALIERHLRPAERDAA